MPRVPRGRRLSGRGPGTASAPMTRAGCFSNASARIIRQAASKHCACRSDGVETTPPPAGLRRRDAFIHAGTILDAFFSTSMSKAKLRKRRWSPRGRPTAQGQHFETRRRRSRRRPAPAESTTASHAWGLVGRRCWPRSRRETPYSPRLAFATRRPFRTTRGGARGLILCVNRRPP